MTKALLSPPMSTSLLHRRPTPIRTSVWLNYFDESTPYTHLRLGTCTRFWAEHESGVEVDGLKAVAR